MKHHVSSAVFFSTLATAGMLGLAMPASAQMGPGAMDPQKGMPMSGAQQMSGMAQEMSEQMMRMSGEMTEGKINPIQQKQMAERMRTMAAMMQDMSGMMTKGTMGTGVLMDTETQNKMNQMRKQMQMMSPGAKSMDK